MTTSCSSWPNTRNKSDQLYFLQRVFSQYRSGKGRKRDRDKDEEVESITTESMRKTTESMRKTNESMRKTNEKDKALVNIGIQVLLKYSPYLLQLCTENNRVKKVCNPSQLHLLSQDEFQRACEILISKKDHIIGSLMCNIKKDDFMAVVNALFVMEKIISQNYVNISKKMKNLET